MSNIIATNKRAFRDYAVLETVECGIELKGSEVKSVRAGKISFNDSFARIEKGQVFLYNTHINSYEQASYMNVEPTRQRRLLMHRGQIRKFDAEICQKGLTLIPLKVYFNSRGFVKLELALCKGKKSYDHREDIKRREVDKKIRQTMKARNK
ncbi:MAG TPA: SsrA-binding protein SmpB [Candidatus Omnitrophota bacterium]|nr:SsrA-binding protein SmpB [Candidatus Omnitrophota bacterium]